MVDDIKIVPDRDEPLVEPRISSPERKGDSRKRAAASPASRRPPPPKSSSSPLTGVLCVMVIMVSGAAAYLFLQTKTLTEQRNDLDSRVKVLEQKLSITDESLSESGAAIQTILKDQQEDLEFQMTEIRKLWGVSYDTNRPEIDRLKKTQSTQAAQLTDIRGEVEPLTGTVENLRSRVDAVSNQSLSLSAGFDDLEQQVRQLNDTLASIKSDVASQGNRVSDHSAAIESIDQYRRQINQRLIDLENQGRSAPVQ